jgi:GNAT superfamily N-acetyltransferase
MITVREARPGDGALLLETTRQLAELHGMSKNFVATPELYENALFCALPIIGALIAEVDGVFAGSIVWHRSFSTNSGREIIYLEDLVVLKSYQRLGVGRALMKQLARAAVACGTYAMFWLKATWNKEAEAFYRSIGAEIDKGFDICTVKHDSLKALAA